MGKETGGRVPEEVKNTGVAQKMSISHLPY